MDVTMLTTIDLNSDLGESFGPYSIGNDEAMLRLVTSANVACGGHAGDDETMYRTVRMAAERGVVIGAHPGYRDRMGFGRRVVPMASEDIGRMVAAQVGALQGVCALAGAQVRYVKPHGALANLAADDIEVAGAIVSAVAKLPGSLSILAISGTELEAAARSCGVPVLSEIYADRAYQSSGRLVPRSVEGSVLHDPELIAARLAEFARTGLMPVVDGQPVRLAAHSVCVHGDTEGAVQIASHVRAALEAAGVNVASFG